jgi:hypothetical protein
MRGWVGDVAGIGAVFLRKLIVPMGFPLDDIFMLSTVYV